MKNKILYIVSFFSLYAPSSALAHSGHDEEGLLAQFFNKAHIFENSISLGILIVLGVYTIMRIKEKKKVEITENKKQDN